MSKLGCTVQNISSVNRLVLLVEMASSGTIVVEMDVPSVVMAYEEPW